MNARRRIEIMSHTENLNDEQLSAYTKHGRKLRERYGRPKVGTREHDHYILQNDMASMYWK